MKPLSALLPSHLRMTHKLTQNRKKSVETMEQRGQESIWLWVEQLLKVPGRSKSHFGEQLITRRLVVQVRPPQPE